MASFLDQPGTGGGILPPYGEAVPLSEVNQNLGGGGPVPSILPPVTEQIGSVTHATQNPGTTTTTTQNNGGNPPPQGPSISGTLDNCSKSVSVKADGVPNGALVSIYVNGFLVGSTIYQEPIIEYGSLPPIEVPISGCLKAGDVVRATWASGNTTSTVGSGAVVVCSADRSVVTQHYNPARTGWNPNEKIINTSNVASLRWLFDVKVDGKVYAQPLYLPHQYFPKSGSAHNTMFVATQNDSVYAFDADNGLLIWHGSLPQTGETAVPYYREEGSNIPNPPNPGNIGDVDIAPVIGITGTPVIDCGCEGKCGSSASTKCCSCSCGCGSSSQSGIGSGSSAGSQRPTTLYVVAKTYRASDASFHLYLHALDVSTGNDLPSSPVELKASVLGTGGSAGTGGNDGNGHAVFNPFDLINRSALLLLNGTIYVACCALTDPHINDPNGWIFAFDAISLNQKAVFCTAPDNVTDVNETLIANNGGIWGSGMGIATDGTYIYCTTADGSFNADVNGTNYGDSIIKLTQDLRVASWFAPANNFRLFYNDKDFGSSGVLVVPSQQSGTSQNFVVASGKEGILFLLNRENLGGFVGAPSNLNDLKDPNIDIVSTVTNAEATKANPVSNPNAVFSARLTQSGDLTAGPAYYSDASGQYLFYCGDTGSICAFSLTNGVLMPLGKSKEKFPLGGTTITISSKQNAAGTAIVWAISRDKNPHADKNSPHQLSLFAYSLSDFVPSGAMPTALIQLPIGLWGSTRAFIEPTVINGKVYAAWDTFPMLSSYITSGNLGTYWVRAFGFGTAVGVPTPIGG